MTVQVMGKFCGITGATSGFVALSIALVLGISSCRGTVGVVSDHPLPSPSEAPSQNGAQTPSLSVAPDGVNVILLIGDGMGPAQLAAGMFASAGKIAVERMPIVGLHKNESSDNLVTDSAAGATAFSCGQKTYNGAIGVLSDSATCKTLLERAAELGRPTGLVATSTIVHATPASFFAHEALRSSYENIARQLVDAPVEFFFGGGLNFFSSRESDDRDLVEEMKAKGRVVETFLETPAEEAKPDPSKPYGYLSANADPLPAAQGRTYLPGASRLALDYLAGRDTAGRGFFLMIEGSQIDWGGHANQGDYIVSEVQDFSRALDVVLDWAQDHPNTLVVVTADHETGGFSINYGSSRDSLIYGFTSDYHTATLIPVFASGVGAERFSGVYENTAIYGKVLAVLEGGSGVK